MTVGKHQMKESGEMPGANASERDSGELEEANHPGGDAGDVGEGAGGGAGGVVGVSPSEVWLASVADVMPPLTGAEGVAERLLLHLHYGIDWRAGWVGRRRATYWEHLLPDRVICATYRSEGLRGWWREVADTLESAPRTRAQRTELEALLRGPSAPVLEVLRRECEALVLRTRITTETYRERRTTGQSSAGQSSAGQSSAAPGGQTW